jgi:hypothetical protein
MPSDFKKSQAWWHMQKSPLLGRWRQEYCKIETKGLVTEVLEHLPSLHEAQDSIPVPQIKQTKKKM